MPSASVTIAAPGPVVWRLISDVTRMGDWSPETTGATWLDGSTAPGVGARFKGRNKRRGSWTTTCTVTAATPGREFAFTVGKGETEWSYTITDDDQGCVLTESFEILRPPGIVGRWLTRLGTGVPWSQREADLLVGVRQTLDRIKSVAETDSTPG